MSSRTTLLIASVVLGLVNAIVRPIMVLVTLPITTITLGLFLLIVNGVAFTLASTLVPGFTVTDFGSAVIGALLMGVMSWILGWFRRPD